MWKCKECENGSKCNKKVNQDFTIECISNNLKHFTELKIPDVSNSAEYTNGYRDGWRDCCKDVKEFG